jgi:hypothetical protein
MRKFPFNITGFKGLKPFRDQAKYEPYFETFNNLWMKSNLVSKFQIGSVLPVQETFPFPQVIRGTMHTVLCTGTSVYSYDEDTNSSVLMLSGLTAGGRWSCADYGNFMLLSNGKVTLARSPSTGVWSIVDEIPQGTAIYNYNGQCIVVGAQI